MNNAFELEGYRNELGNIDSNISRAQDSKVVSHLALRYRIYTMCQNH